MSKSKTQFDHNLESKKATIKGLKQSKNYRTDYNKFKEGFIEKNTVKSMVFENGSALALIFKEMQKLHTEVQQLKNQLNGEFKTN